MKWVLIVSFIVFANDGHPKKDVYSSNEFRAYTATKKECLILKKSLVIADYERDGFFVGDISCKEI